MLLPPFFAAAGVRWREMPPNLRGAAWLLLSTLLFAGVNGCVRGLSGSLHPAEIAFFRCLFGLIVLFPFLVRQGRMPFATNKIWLHILRIIVGVSSMLTSFYALAHLPMATAVSLTFTKPLFMIVLALLFLGETVRWRRSVATVVGFCGVVIMMNPSQGLSLEPAFLWGLFSALLLAVVLVCIKILTASEKPMTMLFYFTLGATVGTFVPALLVWQTPTWNELFWLLLMGTAASGGQYCSVRAYRLAEATAITPIDYCQLLFSGMIGFMLFGEIPTVWTIIGAGVIVASTFYIMNREARSLRERRKNIALLPPPDTKVKTRPSVVSDRCERDEPPA